MFGNNTTATTIQGIAVEESRKRWMECQGVKNWEGLIDPLDDTLRAQILSYARFVEAAYRCFDFDMSSPTYATCRNDIDSMLAQCGLGNHRYRVTKNLYATCTTSVPRWIERILNLASSPESSWIGYMAVCDDAKEISRLGHRRVVIAFRGTATAREWLENLRVILTPLSVDMATTLPDCSGDHRQPMVQQGLLSLYTSGCDGRQSLQDTIREEIREIVKGYGGKGEPALSITITGNSLRGALATLTAYDIMTQFSGHEAAVPLVTAVSFGGPRVGNDDFRREVEASDAKVLRIVNHDDPITKVPGFVFDDMAGLGVPAWLQKYTKYAAYAEVGKELRLSSKDRRLPHAKVMARSAINVATCHDLNTYLYLD
ncbi:unnamed protein product [Cuscuta campestris]|uniref:Fungal lipase-type domain-containing protein n=1 Tax=Cuscuta campestris TaxID=132261 RepID=A0A484MBQ2_9ASTE|nr:unnamed protein product [Cuscuta campestris]